ncbi:hypothetical protein ACQ4PT_059459 [Festuca glaucescens]
MDGSKAFCTCILIFIVISSQAEARLFEKVMAVSKVKEPHGELGATKGDGRSVRATREMASAAGAGQDGSKAMPMATTVDSRTTSPGNSPGIGNKGKTNY